MNNVINREQSELTEEQWQVAHVMAQILDNEQQRLELGKEGISAELGKTIAYLRDQVNSRQPDAGVKLFKYLKALVSSGKTIGHSGKTPEYYRILDKVCNQHLRVYQNDADAMLQLLGWVTRLMKYYKTEPIGELSNEAHLSSVEQKASERQIEIRTVARSQEFKVGQILEARVTKISGNKVTYEMMGAIKLTEKEPRKAGSLSEGQSVKVKIVALREDGIIKSVKLAE